MAAEGSGGAFGSCCEELRNAMSGEGFEPLISVGEDDVLYMCVGFVEEGDDDEEAGMLEHPIFFCPFCGKQVQTEDEVRAKAGDDADGM